MKLKEILYETFIDSYGNLIRSVLDPKTSEYLGDKVYSFFDSDHPPKLKKGDTTKFLFNAEDDEVEYEVGPDFDKIGVKPVLAYEDEDIKVMIRSLEQAPSIDDEGKLTDFNPDPSYTHELTITIKTEVY